MNSQKKTVLTSKLTLFLLISCLVFSLSAVSVGQTVKLELLHAWTTFRTAMVDEMIEDFIAEFPHVEVEARVIPNSQLNEQFTLAYAAGSPPDVVMINTKNLMSLSDQGVFLALDEFIERDGIDRNIWVPSELGLGEFDGSLYGLPIRTGSESGNILYYNKRLFEEGGLDSQRPPATFDELLEYSKKLVRYDGDSIVLNPINNLAQKATVQPTLNWLYAGGGEFLSEDLRTIRYDSDETANAFNFVYQFRNEVYRNVGDDNMGNEDFYNGRSAMFLWGSEGFSYVWDQDPDFPLGAGPRPKDMNSQYIGANSGTWHYAIPATVENPEEAWELLKWLTIREESAGWFIREQGRASPIRAYNAHPEYFEINPLTHVLGEVLEQVQHVPILPIHDEIAVPLRDAFRQVIEGEAPAASALKDAAERAQSILDAYWAERDAK